MGVGWRRAFCIASSGQRRSPLEDEDEWGSTSPTELKSSTRFGFFSSAPNTPWSSSSSSSEIPSLRSRAISEAQDAEPRLLHCKTGSALLGSHSDPSSPRRSRLMFDFWKSGFKSESNDCRICSNGTRIGQKSMAFTDASESGLYPWPSTWGEDNAVIGMKAALTMPRTPQMPTTRYYDDDEPLTSPGFRRSKFYTIPEEFEEEVGDASDERHPPYEPSGRVQVEILPERAVISSNRSYETRVALLVVKAAPLQFEAPQRVPVDLVVVLDLNCDASGDKLDILKAAMNVVISSLGPSDRLSIVAFAENSKRMLGLKRMTARGRRTARVTVDHLLCGTQRGRCVGEALRKASKVLEDRCEKNPVSSILLLSNIRNEAVRVADFYSESMMSTGSKARFAYIEISSESGSLISEDLFAKSLASILNVVVWNLKIDLGFADSVSSAEIAAVYSRNKGQCTLLGSGSIWIGDLYAEEEQELLVEMRIPSSAAGSDHVMSTRCSYNDPACSEVHCEDQKVLVYGPRVAEQSLNPRSERLRNVFITTRAIAESKRSVERDDYAGARRLIASAQALMMQSGSRSGHECTKALEVEFVEIHRQKQKKMEMESMCRQAQGKDKRVDPLAPPKSWRAVEKLADVVMMKRSLNRVGDLHGFELARF